jgi:hypothetical protein
MTSFPEGVQDKLRGIKVATIPDRSGQYLRLSLIKTLTPAEFSPTPYFLEIRLAKTETTSGIGKDATIRRMRLTTTLTYTLREKETGHPLTQGTLKAHGSYNYLLDGFYANSVSREAAEFETLDMLSSLVVLELGRYFSDPSEKDSHTPQPVSPAQNWGQP